MHDRVLILCICCAFLVGCEKQRAQPKSAIREAYGAALGGRPKELARIVARSLEVLHHRASAAGITLLMDTVFTGPPETVRVLVEAGAPLDVQESSQGYSALHFAAFRGDLRMLKLLVDHGAPLEYSRHGPKFPPEAVPEGYPPKPPYRDTYYSPLEVAAGRGELDAVRWLVTRGAMLNPPPDEDGWHYPNALHAAASYPILSDDRRHPGGSSNRAVIEYLLAEGADPNQSWEIWGTPLHVATNLRFLEGARVLLESPKTNVNAVFRHGTTALHLLSQRPMTCSSSLIKLGKEQDVEFARLLLAHGADPTQRNVDGQSALDQARKEHRDDLLSLFEASQSTPAP